MNIIELIYSHQESFSKGQRALADFILQNIDRVCFMSLKEFSHEAGTTAVTVLRFARKLGLDGFVDLKKELQAYTSTKIDPQDKLEFAIGQVKTEMDEVIMEIGQMDLLNLQRTYERLNPAELLRACDILKESDHVYLAANNIAFGIAVCFHSRLNAVSIYTDHFDFKSTGLMAARLAQASPKDAFVIITFPPYTRELVFLARQLYESGIPVILLSDAKDSEIAPFASVVIECSTATPIFYNSYTAGMAAANVLTSIVALQMGTRVQERRSRGQQLRSELERFMRE